MKSSKHKYNKGYTGIIAGSDLYPGAPLLSSKAAEKTGSSYVELTPLIKSKELLNIDHLVFIPYNNWFDNHFESVLNNVLNLISEITEDNEPFILMTSCGMSAKVMITEVYKKYNNGIYLDVGNGLDYLCWKDTRGWSNIYTHSYLKELFKNVIGDSKNY